MLVDDLLEVMKIPKFYSYFLVKIKIPHKYSISLFTWHNGY